jgi:xanthine dehydrogenase small subunit
MAPIPARAPRTEAALLDQPWQRTTIEAACIHLAEDYAPLSDARASAGYRLQCAANLLRRFYLQQEGAISVLRLQDVLHEPS